MDQVTTVRFIALAVTALAIGGLLLRSERRSREEASSPLFGRVILYALAAYIAMVTLSLTQAGNLAEGLLTISKAALWAGVIILFALLLKRTPTAFELFTRCLTTVAVGLAAIGLAQYYGVAFDGYVQNAGLANRNLLASALCLMLPFVLFVIMQPVRAWRWIGTATAALAVAVVILSNSRATWFALTVASVATVVIWRVWASAARMPLGQRATLRKRLITAAIVVAATAVLFTTSYVRHGDQEPALQRAISATTFSQGSVAERLAMWRHSLGMSGDHPWLGVGAGNWKLVSPAYGPISHRVLAGDLFFQRPHNDYLWILSESGPAALLCYLIVFASALWCCLRIIKNSDSRHDVTAATTILFGVVMYMVISFFSYPMERIVHTLLAALLLASVLAIYRHNEKTRSPASAGKRKALIVVGMVLTIPALVIGPARLISEVHTKNLLTGRAQGDWATVISEADLALTSFNQLDHTATPLAWHRGVANFTLQDYDAAFDDFKKALEAHPNHLHVLNNLGTCHEREGRHDSAEYYYRRAVEIVPGFEETLINLAAALYNAERFDEALQTLESITGPASDVRYDRYLERIRQKIDSLPPNQ
jgi:O-antigen ligase